MRSPEDTSDTLTAGPAVERSRDNKTSYRQGEETGSRLGNGNVEVLFQAIYASEKEAHAQNEKQVRQHASDERSLDNDNFILDQGKDRHDQFDSISVPLARRHPKFGGYRLGNYPNVALRRPPRVSPVLKPRSDASR
jgi:hypothetical protein